MSDEITITIPLNLLGDLDNLNPKTIAAALGSVRDFEKAQNQIKFLVEYINAVGKSLEQMLNEYDEYAKAQALRILVTDLKNFSE